MNTDTRPTVLLLPGWQNSGPAHWQSRWEALYGYTRVQQHDWMRPLRGDWMMQLEEAVLAAPGPVLLVAHSLGCILTAAWAQHSQHRQRVRAALLVAPGDPEREALRSVLPSWSPVVMQPLPFASVLLGSQNDPYCSVARAQAFAAAWGARWVDCGAVGHINADSGLGDWPVGHALLHTLLPAQPGDPWPAIDAAAIDAATLAPATMAAAASTVAASASAAFTPAAGPGSGSGSGSG